MSHKPTPWILTTIPSLFITIAAGAVYRYYQGINPFENLRCEIPDADDFCKGQVDLLGYFVLFIFMLQPTTIQ